MDEKQIKKIVRAEITNIMNAGRTKQRSCLPGMEFEGPLAFFWDTKEVPIEAIAIAFIELVEEANRRGFDSGRLGKIGEETRKRLKERTP